MSVADLLVPNPYPLNIGAISSPSITTGALTVDAALGAGTLLVRTAAFHPLQVNNISATSGNDLVFLNNGVLTGGFGMNNSSNDVYVWSYVPAAAVKIGTSNTERLRIPPAGIAVNDSATHALSLATASTTLVSRTLDGGAYTPVWTLISGFTGVGALVGFFSRNGNTVTVCVNIFSVQAITGGGNAASITLPIPPAANFTVGAQLLGNATLQSLTVTSTSRISAQVGGNEALVTVIASAPGVTGDFTATFMYDI